MDLYEVKATWDALFNAVMVFVLAGCNLFVPQIVTDTPASDPTTN